MLEIKSTREASLHGLKVLVYGGSGVGKTRLCATTGAPENTLIISAEAGLLSLRDFDIDAVTVKTLADLKEAYKLLVSSENKYRWVCLDSISEIAEAVLAYEMANTEHGMKAYGAMQDKMLGVIKNFRDLPGINVYFSCKEEYVQDEGGLIHQPSLPGKKFAQGIAYYFDEVFNLRTMVNAEGADERVLQCIADDKHVAKDRSGALDKFEKPSLSRILKKIKGGK